MTTDNKTLADVQPGGRVRLGDQALNTSEGARRYVAYFFATKLRRHDFGDYILTELAGDFACALAQHLSAQPSPGGQGDALLHQARKLFDELGAIADDDKCVAILAAALAASQPVGNYEVQTENGPLKCSLAVYAEWQKNEEYIERLKAELAARQPVGEVSKYLAELQAAVKLGGMEVTERADEDGPFPLMLVWEGTIKPVSPPAQAVDLGQFREAVAEWRSNWANYGRTMTSAGRDTSKARRNVDEADRLLALIDSHSGVSRD